MAEMAAPELTVGFGLTFKVLVAVKFPQAPPAVVSVSVTDAGAFEAAVYVVELGVLPELFEKLPPAPPSDQTADVAPPPKAPPKAVVIPPWQIALIVPPTFIVGLGLTVKFLVANTVPQDPPAVVSVKVIDAGAFEAAV
jgi:hypothetical protein